MGGHIGHDANGNPECDGLSNQGAGGYSGPSPEQIAAQQAAARAAAVAAAKAEREKKEAIEAEAQRKAEADKQKQIDFEQNKENAISDMKGISENEPGLKGVGQESDLGLKGVGETGSGDLGLKTLFEKPTGDASPVDTRVKEPSKLDVGKNINFDAVNVQGGVPNAVQLKKDLLGNFSSSILQRTTQPNEQVQEIMRSFKTGGPPNPVKNIDNLAVGDVILVASVQMNESIKDETPDHLEDVVKSNSINFLDRYASDNWSSPASHAAIFLGERNGKRWYLNNTSDHGPVIIEEKDFLKEYGHRQMDVATLVGQPLSQHEGQELWKGAHELRNTTSYGIWANDKMVCSEASRWALVRAGRRVPETQSEDVKIFGIDIGLNKKQFVNFSPSDFYENQQYFVVHQLGVQRKGEGNP
jgi:sRNA-binding protein